MTPIESSVLLLLLLHLLLLLLLHLLLLAGTVTYSLRCSVAA
jgi:hypothetical protein